MAYTERFPIEFDPVAHPDAIAIGPFVRFTVLTSRLLRLEYSPTDIFEDRPSQAFWVRRQPVPAFRARQENGRFEIETDHLHLRYLIGEEGFTADSLTITLKESDSTWQYGQSDPLNLSGTARTLDNVSGVLALEQGLMSRSGWAVCDDTRRLVFNEAGWLEPRNAPNGYLDLYFFGYGHDYYACLRDLTKVAGQAPVVPRWALGNWWSRYWAYSAGELLALVDEFEAHDVPLSVCIVDMDWHITDTGNASSGWTGYTWNRELFPDPPAFLAELHRRGLKTALNLHPAEGLHPHEEQYEALAERLGIDPETQAPVPFDIADPTFTRAYFELLHHPHEADGVDFWWMDWQQGTVCGLPGLDPLWWLNHLHFYDLGRGGKKRSFIFSRWGGLGNHRYPIGFSGDAHVDWESLAFQPYFTATAANVNYGWWSHDIGGHMRGIEEPELYARWVQFGVFSPILRLHSTNNPFHERRPWGHDAETERVASEALRLRHALIPYLYTMAWRNHADSIPLIRPMYYDHPTAEPAYHCPDQYAFGSELVVAPFVAPAEADTRLSRQAVWLPKGDWFEFFSGARYPGDGWHAVHGGLDDIPVFARAGAIVPLAPRARGWGGADNPEALEIHVFPGADNRFELYEDGGGGDLGAGRLTPIVQQWSPQRWEVKIEAAQGSRQPVVAHHIPSERAYTVRFRGLRPDEVTVAAQRNGEAVNVSTCYDEQTATLRVSPVAMTAHDTLTVTAATQAGTLLAPGDYRLAAGRKLVRAFRMNTHRKLSLDSKLPAVVDRPGLLADYELSLTASQLRALAEVITGAGFHRSSTRRSRDEAIVLWNNGDREAVRFRLAAQDLNHQPVAQRGSLPRFAVLTLGEYALSLHVGNQPSEGHTTVGGWFDSLPDRIRAGQVGNLEAAVQFDIPGAGGRTAFLRIQGGQATLVDGLHSRPDATIAAAVPDWLALLNGERSPEELFLEGKVTVAGNLELVLRFAKALRVAPTDKFLADKWRLDVDYLDVLRVHLGNA